MFRTLDETIAVAPQLAPEDMAAAAAQGFTTIVNNRPDGEEPGQPTDAQMRRAAEAAGLAYRAIPVTHAGFADGTIDAMRMVLEGASGPVLAYCRSGTRSAFLWALARARIGDDPAALVRKARGAGYDLAPIAQYFEAD